LRDDSPRLGHWLKLRVLNRHGSPAINARAMLSGRGGAQMRELRSGSTYQSQNALEIHFGLGETTSIDSLEILWPDGQKSRMKDVQADQTLTIKEPAEATSPR
jgi:enediyne biosynthesis protein E4